MKYAAILAGGVGKRMAGPVPKQFITLNGETIIVRTIRKILSSGLFDVLVIAIHQDWRTCLEELITQSGMDRAPIHITCGGKERLDSIQNTLTYIENAFSVQEEDDIVIFDAVRPFVPVSMMKSSLEALQQHKAVVAALPVVDTMLWIEKGDTVTDMPARSHLFHGQAPDSFKLTVLIKALNELTEDERAHITGTAQICMMKGIPIHTVPGDPRNIKITTPFDIQLGEMLCRMEEA